MKPKKTIFPLLTLGIVVASLLATLSPSLASLAEYQRSAVELGQWWRLLTGNFTHWDLNHLFWDLATFALLCFALETGLVGTEPLKKTNLLLCFLTTGALISIATYVFEPTIVASRGLSGLCVSAFCLLCLGVYRQARCAGDRSWKYLSLLPMLGLSMKLGYEYFSGNAIFVNSIDAGFEVLVLAHLVGMLSVVVWSISTLSAPRALRFNK